MAVLENNSRLSRPTRDRLIREAAEKIEREVPQKVILRWLIHESRYTLSGAEHLLREAKLIASIPLEKKGESLI